MFFLLLRLSPWLLAALSVLVSWWQWRASELYPWPLSIVLVGYVAAAGGLVWRSKHWREGLLALWPTCLAIVAIGFGHLLMENPAPRFFTTALFAFIPWLTLRLGWLLLYESSHYPPQAFFRFHLALVPVCLWYVFSTLQGIQVFLSPPLSVILLAALLTTAAVFAGTIRTWQDPRERRWFWASLLVGMHLAILLVILPNNMALHGTVAAFLVAIPLRLRQLAQENKKLPSRLWLEGSIYVVAWVALFATTRWQ